MPTGALTGWHAAASHSDAPTWRIKELDGGKDKTFARAETEGYGGMLMSTWLDRPLSVAGRVLVRTETGIESRLVHPEKAVGCIPNLCIHFNREANSVKYNPQGGYAAGVWRRRQGLRSLLAEEAGVKPEEILDADLVLCTLDKATQVGLQGEWFMAPRIDDLECPIPPSAAFGCTGREPGRGDVWAMFDNEEVGSSSRQGAQGYPDGRCAGPHRGEPGRQPGAEHPRTHQQSAAQRRQRPCHPPQPSGGQRTRYTRHPGRRWC